MFKPAHTFTMHPKIGLFGPSGCGKTIFALGWPSVAMIDTEGRGALYGNQYDYLRWPVHSIKEIKEALLTANRQADVNTILLDSITVPRSAILAKLSNEDGSLGYRERAMVNVALGGIFSTIAQLNKAVIVIAHEQTDYRTEGKGIVESGVKAEGGNDFAYAFDYILQMNMQRRIKIHKQAGPLLAADGYLDSIHYSNFAALFNPQPASNGASNGTGWTKAEMNSYWTYWQEHGLSKSDVTAALGVSSAEEWRDTLDKAMAVTNAWLDEQAAGKDAK